MGKSKSDLEKVQERAVNAITYTNSKIGQLGVSSRWLYSALVRIQRQFDAIKHVPEEKAKEYEQVKELSRSWRLKASKIEEQYNNAMNTGKATGAAGVFGIGLATLGPTAAMGVATTFGVASTGTAISSLAGAAANNAALAWLGGGAIAAGGGGMAGGEALLALAGPVGWTIAGVAFVVSGVLFWNAIKNKKALERIFMLVAYRDEKKYKLAHVAIGMRINSMLEEGDNLDDAMIDIATMGIDYPSMTEEQQYRLGTYVNLMRAATQLLVNPISDLQPAYTMEDLTKFREECSRYVNYNIVNLNSKNLQEYLIRSACVKSLNINTENRNNLIVGLANMLYDIRLDEDDRNVLKKTLKKNEGFLKAFSLTSETFDGPFDSFVDIAYLAITSKYKKVDPDNNS